MNPLFTVLIHLPPSPPIGSATPPSEAPHPGDYCAFGITAIRAVTRLQWLISFPSPSLLSPRVAARPSTFPAAITVIVIVVLQAFWICSHYLYWSTFEFSRFFSLLHGFFRDYQRLVYCYCLLYFPYTGSLY